MDENEVVLQDGKKKGGIFTLIVVLLLLVSLCGNVVLFLNYTEKKNLAEEVGAIYSESYFHYNSLTVDSFYEKIASGEEFIAIITRPNCPNCAALERPIIELAEAKGIADKIYHVNVVILRRDNEAWAALKERHHFEGTPSYIRFKDGENVSSVGWTPDGGISYEMVSGWLDQQSDFFAR